MSNTGRALLSNTPSGGSLTPPARTAASGNGYNGQELEAPANANNSGLGSSVRNGLVSSGAGFALNKGLDLLGNNTQNPMTAALDTKPFVAHDSTSSSAPTNFLAPGPASPSPAMPMGAAPIGSVASATDVQNSLQVSAKQYGLTTEMPRGNIQSLQSEFNNIANGGGMNVSKFNSPQSQGMFGEQIPITGIFNDPLLSITPIGLGPIGFI